MAHSIPSASRALFAALAFTLVVASSAAAQDAGPITPMPAGAVRLQRSRPSHEKLETLRFFKANRDFIRGRLERLDRRALDVSQGPETLDPRFLDYAHLLAAVDAASDSLARSDAARKDRGLLASVTDLGLLEAQLDQMGRMLDSQRAALGVMQADFASHQQTALLVVASGDPGANAPTELTFHLEDGDTLTVPLDAAARATLRSGGMIEIFHGLIEPRAQVLEFGLGGPLWPRGDTGYLSVDPAHDRLNCVRLDLGRLDTAQGAGSVAASTWVRAGAALAAGDDAQP